MLTFVQWVCNNLFIRIFIKVLKLRKAFLIFLKGGSKNYACLILFLFSNMPWQISARNRTRYIRKDICFDLFLFFCMSDQNRHSCIVHLRLIQSGFSHAFVVYSVEIRVMNIQSALLQGVETSCMCVCTKRVCVSITERKACSVVIYST